LRRVPAAISRATIPFAFAALIALALAGCGEDEPAAAGEPTKTPAASAFPPVDGGTLEDLFDRATADDDTVVLPAGQVLSQGRNRFGFGVFSVGGEQIPDAEVAIYAAAGPSGSAEGPFPARVEDLETEAAFTAQTTSGDPDAAKTVYVADVVVEKPGELRLLAMVRGDDGELGAVRIPSLTVSSQDGIPGPGEPAPKVETPTVEDVGNVQEIDTRVPPDSMHDLNFADVLGKRPAVLLFATPALCTSRVCGPVVDVAEQVKRDHQGEVAFIHQEIYQDNTPPALRPQVEDFNLPTEPWLFVIDCDGIVDSRIEGAFSVAELTAAVDRVADSC